jgi:poly-beta-1,6-N-acetyl-D-glucosamine synthase
METFYLIIFWACLLMLFYSYLGYGGILYFLVTIKRLMKQKRSAQTPSPYLPEVTFMVAAYNEADYIEKKINNTLQLNYPKNKLKLLFVTDGSDDATPELIKKYPQIQLLHQPERKGKIAAVNRAMQFVDTEIVIFSDANTILNQEAIINMVRHYQNEKVGVIAGEKRIISKEKDSASGAGEGIYWKYESILKKWDSELYSAVGAAGELFSIRTKLFEPVATDTLIEDFYLTLKIAQKGYKIVYEPEAYAMEGPSASVKEELKRKIRIAAGGLQAVVRLYPLLNPFKYGILSFQYVSHRVLRWTLAPLALPLIFISNIPLALKGTDIYQLSLFLQFAFYLAVIIGYVLEQKSIKLKAFFVPYYFFIMNYAVYRGFIRNLKGSQSVIWEKAKRA